MKYTLEQSAELIPALGTQLTIIATVKASSAPSDISVSSVSLLVVYCSLAPLCTVGLHYLNTCVPAKSQQTSDIYCNIELH